MKSDKRLRRSIERELRSDPTIAVFPIGIEVGDGIATLRGHVRTFEQKCRLHDLVKHAGCKAVIINVQLEPLDLDEDSNVQNRHELRNAPL